jgi:hypothetical protein
MYYNFNPDLPKPLNVIHPRHVKYIQKLMSMPIPDEILYVFLFGGSLEPACDRWSDIDLYAVVDSVDVNTSRNELYNLCKELKHPFDLLAASRDTFLSYVYDIGTVENDILRKGVCIYAKNQKSDTA